ncbi:retrovirus-related pol polyprotein LINE-1 [Tanacetum coccineum]
MERGYTSLFNKIFSGAKMPEEWRLSDVIPVLKNKGNAQVCSNYRGIKLIGHTMKLWDRVIERRLRRETTVSENQERQRDLHFAFLDIEKAYDSVPRELIWKTLIEKGTPRKYIRVIKDMYDGVKTRGSTISPHLFAMILDDLSRGIQEDIPWSMIFVDDIVLFSESAEGLNNRLENWRESLEKNGLSVSREKTEYLRCDFGNGEIAHNEEVDVCVGDKILQPKQSFRYLGSMIHKSERIDEDVSHQCCPITKALANRVEVAELRMLRWTCGRTMLDMIPNVVYRAELEVENIINKMREGRLRWFGHVRRRP